MNYTVYRITNPKGKIYIGISRSLESRMTSYRNLTCKGQPLIYRSLVKYGYQNHKIDFPYKNLNRKEAELVEIALIEVYKTFNSSLNISNGGRTAIHIKGKKVMQFSLDGNYIKTWLSPSEVQREHPSIKASSVARGARLKTYYGKGFLWIYQEDYKKGLRPNWKFENKTTIPKEVHQYDRHGNYITSYPSVEEAARQVGYVPNTIKASCTGKSKVSREFIFSYTRRVVEPYYSSIKKRSKKVYVYDSNKRLINTHSSATDAANFYGFSQSAMYRYALTPNKLINKQYYFSYESN